MFWGLGKPINVVFIIQVKNIKAAIAKASSLEEVERLNQMLRTGQIPGGAKPTSTGTSVTYVNTACETVSPFFHFHVHDFLQL